MVYGSIYESSSMNDGSFLPEYATPDAPYRMVIEAMETDQAMFDIVIERDFLEATSVNDEQLLEAYTVVNEGFAASMWDAIHGLLEKIKNKIISIAKAATVKMQAFFTKDNKALVEKYNKYMGAAADAVTIKGFQKRSKDFETVVDFGWIGDKFDAAIAASTAEEAQKIAKEATADAALTAILGTNTTSSSFNKDYKKSVFDNEAEVTFGSIKDDVVKSLTNYQTLVGAINSEKTRMNTVIEGSKNAVKAKKKDSRSEKDKDAKALETAQANAGKSIATTEEKVAGKVFGAMMDAMKFDLKQCRKAYITAASKAAGGAAAPATKAANEGSELYDEDMLDAVLSLESYNVDSFFDQESYDEEELTA